MISVKFKGKVYNDGKRDAFGHIRFNGNEFEYVPDNEYNKTPYVIVHGFKQTGPNCWTHTARKSTAKVTILSD